MNAESPQAWALVPYDDRFARRQLHAGRMVPAFRTYAWGRETIIVNGEIRLHHEGVSTTLYMPGDQGGPSRVQWLDERRYNPRHYSNHGYVCYGCPFYGVSFYKGRGSDQCAHPLYLELHGCPQSIGYHPGCPMLGLRSERAQSLARASEKARYIFWEYYDSAHRSTARREGFSPLAAHLGRKYEN